MTKATDDRKQLYTLLRVGNSELGKALVGWNEETYRDLLQRHGATKDSGFSASSMNLAQLSKALDEMKSKGFKPKRSKAKQSEKLSDWRKPRIAKLNAMWCALADADVVQNRSQTAMAAWCENHVNELTKLHWATSEQLNKAIEMMKGMKATHGVKQDERYD